MDARLKHLDLVAHRGFPLAFPENTLLGYRQAVVHGARYVEADVQCSRDGVPVLYHDATTRRLSGTRGRIHEQTLEQLGELSAYHPKRFGDRFRGTPISTLQAFADWVSENPVTAFVEIKPESLETFGVEAVVRWVTQALDGVEDQCVVISFDDDCVARAASLGRFATGWVLPRWNTRTEARARELAPDYLFVDEAMLPPESKPLWQGAWQWAVYVVDDLARALAYVDRGIRLVETDAVGDLMDQYRAGYLETSR